MARAASDSGRDRSEPESGPDSSRWSYRAAPVGRQLTRSVAELRVRPRTASCAGSRRRRCGGGRCAGGGRLCTSRSCRPVAELVAPLAIDGQGDRAGGRLVTAMCGRPRITTGRLVSVCGQIGVSTIASRSGVRMGPPPPGCRRSIRWGSRRSARRPCRWSSRSHPARRSDPAAGRSTRWVMTASFRAVRAHISRPPLRTVTRRRMRSSMGSRPAQAASMASRASPRA